MAAVLSIRSTPVARFLAAALLFTVAAPLGATDTWTAPFPGILYLRRVTASSDLHVLKVDLCAPGVSMRTTASSEKGRTTSSFGTLVGADIAINGDFHNTTTFIPDGPAAHNGSFWHVNDHTYTAPAAFGTNWSALRPHPLTWGAESWMREVVGGHPTLLENGLRVNNNGDSLCTALHPRTALGLSQDRRTLIVAVVDGRRTNAVGMTCDELENLLLEMGAYHGLNLDGGGSTTLWFRTGGVMNRPSDGVQRKVSNHLAIYARGTGGAAHCPLEPAPVGECLGRLNDRAAVSAIASGVGYYVASKWGGVTNHGDAAAVASLNSWIAKPVVGAAACATGGVWLVASDGGVFALGGAPFHGSMGGQPLNAPMVGMAGTPSGGGYWLVASDGGLFAFGNAGFYGSMGGQPLNQPVVGMVATPSGGGYWLVASDGGLFAFGNAGFHGSMGGQPLNQPIVGMEATPSGGGYWLVARDGGIFAFGDAGFHGSMGGQPLNGSIIGMAATPAGAGYWLIGADGGTFAFGDAPFFGAAFSDQRCSGNVIERCLDLDGDWVQTWTAAQSCSICQSGNCR